MAGDLKFRTCCFTGHPDIPRCDEEKIVTRVRYLLRPLLREGVVYYGVGGSRGFDMLAAEFLLQLRDEYRQGIKIISVLPYPEWREGWPEKDFLRQQEIMRRSDKVTFASPGPCQNAYLLRDRKLVDGSGYCVCYCNRTDGETADAVRYAIRRGLFVFNAGSWNLAQLRDRRRPFRAGPG